MILNGNSIVQHVIQIKKGIMINVNVSVKNTCIRAFKKDTGYLKSIFDDSVIIWDEIICSWIFYQQKWQILDTTSTNVRSTASIDFDVKKAFAHTTTTTTILLLLLLLLLYCYYYTTTTTTTTTATTIMYSYKKVWRINEE